MNAVVDRGWRRNSRRGEARPVFGLAEWWREWPCHDGVLGRGSRQLWRGALMSLHDIWRDLEAIGSGIWRICHTCAGWFPVLPSWKCIESWGDWTLEIFWFCACACASWLQISPRNIGTRRRGGETYEMVLVPPMPQQVCVKTHGVQGCTLYKTLHVTTSFSLTQVVLKFVFFKLYYLTDHELLSKSKDKLAVKWQRAFWQLPRIIHLCFLRGAVGYRNIPPLRRFQIFLRGIVILFHLLILIRDHVPDTIIDIYAQSC